MQRVFQQSPRLSLRGLGTGSQDVERWRRGRLDRRHHPSRRFGCGNAIGQFPAESHLPRLQRLRPFN